MQRGVRAVGALYGGHLNTTLERLQYSPADTVIVIMSGVYNEGGTAVNVYRP